MGYSPWGHKESDMTKQLTLVQSQFISFVPGDPVVPRNAPVCARARWEKFSPQLFCTELKPETVTVVSLPEWWWYRRKCSGDIWEKLSLNFDRNKPDNHRLAGFFILGALSCVFDGGGGLLAKLFWFFWDPLDYSPPGSFVHGILRKNTGVRCHFLLQGIFLIQGSNPCLLHCRWILYWLSQQGSPSFLLLVVKMLIVEMIIKDDFQVCWLWFFFFLIFGLTPWHVGTLVLWPGIKPTSPALEGRVLTLGPPGLSPDCFLN